jgi:hypothetical protein
VHVALTSGALLNVDELALAQRIVTGQVVPDMVE